MGSADRDKLGERGRAFRDQVTAALDLEAHETALLIEACRTLDRIGALDAVVEAKGPLLPDGRVQPALVESRLQRVTFARLVASLRLPDDFSAAHLDRGQRRGAARGTYVPRHTLEEMRRAKTS